MTSRRDFLKTIITAAGMVSLNNVFSAQDVLAALRPRRLLKLYNPHTGERLTLRYSTRGTWNKEDQEKVFILCKKGITADAIEEFHDHVQVVNRFVIGAVMLTEPILSIMRRELRRINPSLKVTNEEIEGIIATELLKRDVVEGESFEDAKKRVKKATKKTKPKSTQSA